MMLNIEEIKEREQVATQGPWKVEPIAHRGVIAVKEGAAWIDWICSMQMSNRPNCANDTDFIAHAREDIPVLLAEVERLQEENVALRDTIDKMMAQNKRIISSNAAKDQQIVTLKRALELIVASLRENNFNCPDADYFIHQALEQEAKS